MKNILIRDASKLDYRTIVDINDVEIQHTSPMDVKHIRHLDQLSTYHRVAVAWGSVAAFLLAMGEKCPYKNENYEWFSSRYPEFLYIDRIVVAATYRGLNIGTMLYRDIFRYARSNNIPIITCEYNLIPLNEPSRLFHEKFGFKEVGTQWISNGAKKVSLQGAEV